MHLISYLLFKECFETNLLNFNIKPIIVLLKWVFTFDILKIKVSSYSEYTYEINNKFKQHFRETDIKTKQDFKDNLYSIT